MVAKKWRGKWVVDFVGEDGKRLRRVSPVQSREGARAFERSLMGSGPAMEARSSSTSTPSLDPRPEVPSFAAFAPEWLRMYAATNNKPSEVVGKESVLRVHLIPFFGNRRLDEVTAKDVEAFKGEKRASGLGPKTVNNMLTVLRKLLATAIDWEVIEKIPRIRRLNVAPAKFDWLTREEANRFLRAIDAHYPAWRPLFWLALRTGLRRGELFALKWEDIDLTARTVTVRHSVFRGRLYAPKGGKARTVPLTRDVTEVLRQAQGSERDAFLFPAKDGKLSRHQGHADRPLKGALKRAGLRPIRFHDLRHSFASQLASAGRSLKEVQELLGHESIAVTMRYAHLAPGRMREAVAVLDGDVPDVPSAKNLEQPLAQKQKEPGLFEPSPLSEPQIFRNSGGRI